LFAPHAKLRAQVHVAVAVKVHVDDQDHVKEGASHATPWKCHREM
jgi:hypothetical protein